MGSPATRARVLTFRKMLSQPLRVAVVCSNNQNRSMEAHAVLSRKGFCVSSYGTGTRVKLPGPTPQRPNVYDFHTTYEQMRQDLLRKDPRLYTRNGLLGLLDRNQRIKPRPERFQSCQDAFDLILTCDEGVYDLVVAELSSREQVTRQPVHVVNVDIADDAEEAIVGALLLGELCQRLRDAEDLDHDIGRLLQDMEQKSGRPFLHTVCFY